MDPVVQGSFVESYVCLGISEKTDRLVIVLLTKTQHTQQKHTHTFKNKHEATDDQLD
tara:strand:+ start:266 stop:436 length:171 start_codon:yes stop_codon:yes gene_type:complete